MKARYCIIIFILLAVFTLPGCKNTPEDKHSIESEYIRYRVLYLDKMAGDIPTNLLPDIMEAYYTKKYILTRIEGFFDQFSLVQIADMKKNRVTTLVHFFGSRVYYTGEPGEIPAGIHPLSDPEIQYTHDTLRISGLLSHRAIVSLKDQQYDIYYTSDIKIKSPNLTTPYNFIDYVLTDFRVQLSYLKMRLIIEDHVEKEVDPSLFAIPENYQRVSRQTMENIINSLFTKD